MYTLRISRCLILVSTVLLAGCALFDDSSTKKPSNSGLIATPVTYYSTSRARYLGAKYKENLDRLVERIVRNGKTANLQFANNIASVGGIGFFTHSATKTADERYLEVVLAAPETFETKGAHNDKVSRLFTAYGSELLTILSGDNDIYQDKELTGYGLNIAWRNVIAEPAGNRVTLERAIVYLNKEKTRSFLRREINQNDLLAQATIFAVEEDGPLNLVSFRAPEAQPEIRPAIREDDIPSAGVIAKPAASTPAQSIRSETLPVTESVAKKAPPKAPVTVAQKPKPVAPKAPVVAVAPAKPMSPPAPTIALPLEAPTVDSAPVEVAKVESSSPAVAEIAAATPTVKPIVKSAETARAAVEAAKPVPAAPTPKITAPAEVVKPVVVAPAPSAARATPPASQAKPIEIAAPAPAEVVKPVVVAPAPSAARAAPPASQAKPIEIAAPAPVEVFKPVVVAPAPSAELAPPPAVQAKPIENAAPAQLVDAPKPPPVALKPFLPPAPALTSRVPAPEAPKVGKLVPPAPTAIAEPSAAESVSVPAVTEAPARPVVSAPSTPTAKAEMRPAEIVSAPAVAAKSAPQELPVEPALSVPAQTVAQSTIAPASAAPMRPTPAAPPVVAEKTPAKPAGDQLALLTNKPIEAAPAKPAIARAAPKPLEGFIIQLAFNDKERAQRWAESMEKKGFAVSLTEAGEAGSLRVRLGNFVLRDDAERQLKAIKQEGLNGIILNLPQAFRPEARTSIP